MGRRIGQLVAAVVLPGAAEILRGRLLIGTLGALIYCGCWHVMLVGFWLLPEQFPGAAWTLSRRPASERCGEQMDRELRTAVALILQGAFERAEQKLRAVLRCQRDSVAAWAHLGWLHRCNGAPRRAARAYRHALWLDDDGRFESDLRGELAALRAPAPRTADVEFSA